MAQNSPEKKGQTIVVGLVSRLRVLFLFAPVQRSGAGRASAAMVGPNPRDPWGHRSTRRSEVGSGGAPH